jgi:hypothetical protein
MSYSVVTNVQGTYDVHEKESGITIQLERTSSEARNICRKLNLGSGFSGWTPLFFAPKIRTKETS